MRLEEQLRNARPAFDTMLEDAQTRNLNTTELSDPARSSHRRVFASAAAVVLVAALVVGLVVAGGRRNPSKTRPADAPTTTAREQRHFPSRRGMTTVADSHGHPVGYAPTALVIPTNRETESTATARTMIPVVGLEDQLVGYVAYSVGFVRLSVADQPGFDIEDYRAHKWGGCEPQVGNGVGEKYPLCPNPGDPNKP